MSLKDKTIVVTGGSRGLGLGLVEALVEQRAKVTVVARDQAVLAAVEQRLGVGVVSADVSEEGAAQRILADVRPEILVLNAGATPHMEPLDQVIWADFTATWETDVKAGLYWLQAALNLPLKPGSRVLVGSSGAAVSGSPMSGGYGGAKRMLWFMAKYANGVSEQKDLGIRFQAIVPQQMVGGTRAGELRPELHRYCARLMGSVIDGEDVVQDTLVRAFVALQELEEQGLEETPPLRPWLFRIAHNRALDLLRGRAVRMTEPIDAASDVVDPASPDPVEMLMRQEAVKTAVSRFAELPTLQRSVVILKDVLDQSLIQIAALLDLTVDAVKGHLARGRARLREINAQAGLLADARPASAAVARYIGLFNQRDWDGLRALLAADVKLNQSTYPPRAGAADAGML